MSLEHIFFCSISSITDRESWKFSAHLHRAGKTQKQMESQRTAAHADPADLCAGRQLLWLPGPGRTGLAGAGCRLDQGGAVPVFGHLVMAIVCHCGEHTLWPVCLFQKLPSKDLQKGIQQEYPLMPYLKQVDLTCIDC